MVHLGTSAAVRHALTVLVLLSCLPSCFLIAQEPSSSESISGYPVTVDGQEVVRIYEGVGSISAQTRAEMISERLQNLVGDRSADIEKIYAGESQFGSAIQLGDFVLLVVTDSDAKHLQVSRSAMANYYAKQMRDVLRVARLQHSRKYLIRASIYAVVTFGVYLLLLWVVVAGTRWLLKRLVPVAAHLKGIKIQRTELLGGTRIAGMVSAFLRAVRVVIIFALTWVFLGTEFNYFPWTRGHGQRLLDYIVTPIRYVVRALVNYLPNLFYILVIVTMMVYVMKFVRLLAREVERGNITISGFYSEWVQPTYKIIRFLLIAFTAVIIYPYLPGENSPAFKGVGLFIGVLFSLGSTSAVANVVAGVIIIYARGFRVGDWVKIGDNLGEITSLTMLATHLRTYKNEEVIIPNSVVLGAHVTNYTMLAQSSGLILHTKVTIGYEAPWRQIHGLLIEAASKTKNVLQTPVPFVLQTALDDSYVEYEINAYTDKPAEMLNTYSELHGNIQDCFYAAGVEIMSPIYSALRDGNRVQIPEKYLSPDYRPQGFRIAKDDAAAAASSSKP